MLRVLFATTFSLFDETFDFPAFLHLTKCYRIVCVCVSFPPSFFSASPYISSI